MKTRNWLASLALLAAIAQPLGAQQRASLGVGAVFQGYSFDEGLGGATSVNLLMVPVGYELPVSRTLTLDAYTAYARGSTELSGKSYTMQGLVDTRVRASLAVTDWAVITAAVNLPTGNETHDEEEAIVTSALSSELLGFREALWGTGFGVTTGIATAWRMGGTGVGFGASYRVASEFQPAADSAWKYTPGNETRIRLALDRNIGTSKLTLGGTFQNYTDDRIDNRDLFAPGNRWRLDATYSFRASRNSTWTLFATDVWRENGDVFLPRFATNGSQLPDSVFLAGQQNLAVFGIAGATRLGSRIFRPMADFRLMTRETGVEEGWLGGAGFELPLRSGRMDIIPSVRANYGQLEGETDEKFAVYGGEVGLTLRFGGGR